MHDHMLRMGEINARARSRRRIVIALVAMAFVTHLGAFFGGGFVALKFFTAPAEPTVITRHDVREVEVIRCDKAAINQCLRKRL